MIQAKPPLTPTVEDIAVREYLRTLKIPKAVAPKPLTREHERAIRRIEASDPPVVVTEIATEGLRYTIGNGDIIAKAIVTTLIARKLLIANGDALIDGATQTYRLKGGKSA